MQDYTLPVYRCGSRPGQADSVTHDPLLDKSGFRGARLERGVSSHTIRRIAVSETRPKALEAGDGVGSNPSRRCVYNP
ncbi:hypothetical protein RRG08_057790 [Elysia crispata]|uniref:Uncharacterized protein n=1 Tax=Elysia crispata TaxID=231223 RepID=A0AAE1DA45_9GAST|nr:hypothetical protein RRG08_057790 [Elysia crispata]